MTAVSYDLCAPWATADDIGGDCCSGTADADKMDDAITGASLILYNLTGQQWPGECTDVIRPTAEHEPDLLRSGWAPYDGYAGPWGVGRSYNLWPGMWGACTCNRTTVCGIHSVSEIRLPGFPVASVTEVKIDGVTRDPAGYKLQDRQRLVWVPLASDTREGWPCCQRVELAATQPNTWQVSYTWGSAPPAIGRRFAALLACQLYKSLVPDSEGCLLPQRVQAITRQGVTVAVLDSFQVFKDGLTGIAAIDLWISSIMGTNGAKRDRAPQVITPGMLATLRRDQP